MKGNKIYINLVFLLAILISISSISAAVNTNSSNSSVQKQASDCLNSSIQIMNDMSNSGFSILRINDTFREADAIYSAQVILFEKKSKTDFSKVFEDCKKISDIRDLALNAKDELDAFKKFYEESKTEGMNTSSVDVIINKIEFEMKSERYENVQPLINQAYQEITNIKSSYTTLNIFYKSTTRTIGDFFKENWIYIIVTIIVVVLILIIFQKAISRMLIKRKIARLEIRKTTLRELIMKTQKDYFEKGLLSDSSYNIKTKKFAELIRDIEREIPLLREQLMKVSKKGNQSEEKSIEPKQVKKEEIKTIKNKRKIK